MARASCRVLYQNKRIYVIYIYIHRYLCIVPTSGSLSVARRALVVVFCISVACPWCRVVSVACPWCRVVYLSICLSCRLQAYTRRNGQNYAYIYLYICAYIHMYTYACGSMSHPTCRVLHTQKHRKGHIICIYLNIIMNMHVHIYSCMCLIRCVIYKFNHACSEYIQL